MKILQISFCDLLGSRFNGRDLNEYFRRLGHDAQQCVWIKQGDDQFTWMLLEKLYYKKPILSIRDLSNYLLGKLERMLSVQSLLYPWSSQLFFDKRFLSSDIVHYHLIHNGYFSLLSMSKLTSIKPSVWTIHDPWLMCGHCVYPYNCERWKNGCGLCPDLKTFMPMFFDNTKKMFEIKRKILEKSQVDIVVASKYMLNMAKNSPILANKKIHYIPFGVDLKIFKPLDKQLLREKYNIKHDSFVISFRQTKYEYKGLQYIKEALTKINPGNYSMPLTIFTVHEKGFLNEFKDKFHIVELGVVTDEVTMAEFYNCSDLFLMPSTAEAFGMMAIEAMACGKPVIVFEGTALSDVVFAPKGGISVPMKDSVALYSALHSLLINQNERNAIGDEAYRLSREHYDFKVHADRMLDLYRDIIERRKRNNY